MANYTMEIREMMNDALINGVFTFPYDFYGNEQEKKEFEKLFIQYYYLNEIGFETPERFKIKLQAKLNTIMPYYRQLALTEWDKVRTVEQMMTSKNLKESTTHEQTITGDNETTSSGNTSSSSSGNSSANQTSSTSSSLTGSQTSSTSSSLTGSQTSSTIQSGKASNLADGIAQPSLADGYLTSTSQSEDSGNQSSTSQSKDSGEQSSTQSSSDESTLNGTQTLSNESSSNTTQSLKGNNNQSLKETTTFSSVGDVGIQTPAYAIGEWRKVLININQMIIEDCRDLFMQIY